jgi:hypothetical protein
VVVGDNNNNNDDDNSNDNHNNNNNDNSQLSLHSYAEASGEDPALDNYTVDLARQALSFSLSLPCQIISYHHNLLRIVCTCELLPLVTCVAAIKLCLQPKRKH